MNLNLHKIELQKTILQSNKCHQGFKTWVAFRFFEKKRNINSKPRHSRKSNNEWLLSFAILSNRERKSWSNKTELYFKQLEQAFVFFQLHLLLIIILHSPLLRRRPLDGAGDKAS